MTHKERKIDDVSGVWEGHDDDDDGDDGDALLWTWVVHISRTMMNLFA